FDISVMRLRTVNSTKEWPNSSRKRKPVIESPGLGREMPRVRSYPPMPGRRYTVVIADRTSGVIRQLTVNLPLATAIVFTVIALPIVIGLGGKWSARGEIDQLTSSNAGLLIENGSYRAATAELTGQIQSLETVINDLGVRSHVDPAQARAMQKLPAVVKA